MKCDVRDKGPFLLLSLVSIYNEINIVYHAFHFPLIYSHGYSYSFNKRFSFCFSEIEVRVYSNRYGDVRPFFKLSEQSGCNSGAISNYNHEVGIGYIADRNCAILVFIGVAGIGDEGFVLRIAGTYAVSSDIKCMYTENVQDWNWDDFAPLYSPSYNTSQWDYAQEVI